VSNRSDPPSKGGPRTPAPPSPKAPSPVARTPVPPSTRSTTPPTRKNSVSLRLSTIDFDVVNAARRIVEGSLGLVPGERLVVILDEARRDLGPALVEVTRAAGGECTVFELEKVEPRPVRVLPDEIRGALDVAQASILLLGFEEGEQAMRLTVLELVKTLNLRHAHMVGVTRKSLLAGFSVDPARVVDASRAVRTRLRPDSRLKLRSASGSNLDITLSPAHRWAEHVGVIRPGRWENLPSGELMTAPASAEGVFVADGSIGGSFGAAAGLLTRTPVRFEIVEGVVKRVECSDLALQREVEGFMRRDLYADHVGTIILGTNIGITAPVGELVCDQNVPGLHLSLGSTFPEKTGAPNRTRAQLTMTSARADVDLDGAPLIRAGRYMIG